ncbi:hypothetical protein AURDEDRAFT_174354 [Auricularia subglabra TFB-10046 SS5]|nr:hypothetical protein AURDEDRAFT_174354 [Auricularia subglabra TFB-10046 SS5]
MEAESHTPRVAGLMRRIRLRQLRNITLAHVLADDTSRPISLSNFEAYMTFSENALQELQFIVWFQDYAARFFSLADELQRRSPGPPVDVFESKCRLRGLLARLRRKSADSALLSPTYSEKSFGTSNEKLSRHRPCQYSRMRALSDASDSTAVGGDGPCSGTCLCQQPFREECLHVLHTFLRPESSKALRIDNAMRRVTAIRLAQSTHPDVFADVYEYIYNRIENVSLPQFILVASTNMSMRKQMLWYCVGFFSLLTSLALALTTILVIPARHSSRAYRTFAVPFWTFAWISLYASYSGICPHTVFTEPKRLHAWELEEADNRTRSCLASAAVLYPLGGAPRLPPINSPFPVLIAPPAPAVTVTRSTHASTASSSTVGSSIVRAQALDSQQTIHAALDREADPEVPTVCCETVPASIPDINIEGGRLRNGFRRPPIFGPNIVTLDARIRSVHIKTVWTSFFMSLTSTIVFCIVLYTVPSLRH